MKKLGRFLDKKLTRFWTKNWQDFQIFHSKIFRAESQQISKNVHFFGQKRPFFDKKWGKKGENRQKIEKLLKKGVKTPQKWAKNEKNAKNLPFYPLFCPKMVKNGQKSEHFWKIKFLDEVKFWKILETHFWKNWGKFLYKFFDFLTKKSPKKWLKKVQKNEFSHQKNSHFWSYFGQN